MITLPDNAQPDSIIRVALIDDHTLLRELLGTVLSAESDLHVVGTAGGYQEGLTMIRECTPQVLLLDICLGHEDGLQLLHEVKDLSPQLKCIILTGVTDDEYFLKAIRRNADGFLLKNTSMPHLIRVIRQVAGGHKSWDSLLLSRLATLDSKSGSETDVSGMASLTPPERKIARLIAEGMTNREIGEQVRLADKTIRNRISIIMGKLQVSRRSKIAALYIQDETKIRRKKELEPRRA